MTDTNPAEDTLNHLQRLSSKPGVQSTLILSRSDGAIVRATGFVTSTSTSSTAQNAQGEAEGMNGTAGEAGRRQARRPGDDEGESGKAGLRDAEQVASAVWRFFKAAGETALELGDGPKTTNAGGSNGDARDGARGHGEKAGREGKRGATGEDEVKLLRLRLRRCEVVVVPDPKFLLVVIHDTPPA